MTFDFQPQTPDRRLALAAGLLLFVVMAGHTVLETARDSLFLARLPAQQLPFTYAAIALASLIAAELNARVRARLGRSLLTWTLSTGAIGCVLLLPLLRNHASWAPHALYVWVAVIGALAAAQFWLVVSELFTVLEAKQLYAQISAGGMLGAMLGGVLARWAAMRWGDLALLPIGGGLFLLAVLLQRLAMIAQPARGEARASVIGLPALRGGAAAATAPALRSAADELPAISARPREQMRDLRSQRYLQRLMLLTLLSAFAATLIDYAFKAEVARTLPARDLGGFFGAFNAVLSGLALLAQLIVAPRMLSSAGIGRSLWLLPLVLALGAVGVLLAPALGTVLVLRGADASVRYSLYRSSLEVLYLPLATRTRARWKVIVDVVGQRGGQALAALAILGCIALGTAGDGAASVASGGAAISWVALIVLAVAIGWLALAGTMERRYIALFRAKVKAGALETRPEVPALDIRSLESLVASLGSDDDDEVLATIELLVDYGRAHVIPALLLYHPSRAVVVRALEVLAGTDRRDYEGAARRLFERNDDEIRAAAMLALAGRMTPEELRGELAKDLPPAARAAVLVATVARKLDTDGSAAREIDAGCAPSADPATRLMFARAFRLRGSGCCAVYLPRLLVGAGPALQLEVARVMCALPDPRYIPDLIGLLESRHARTVARDALVAIGEPALDALAAALEDDTLPRDLRAHLPRSVSRFGADGTPALRGGLAQRAADIVLDRLERERDGWVRFKLIRALAQLRSHMQEPTRARRVLALCRSNLVAAVHFMAWRLANERDQQHDPRLATAGGELLTAALRDKEAHAIDRAVRLLGLMHSGNVMHDIHQALQSRDPRLRADGIELLLVAPAPGLRGGAHRAPPDIAQALTVLLEHGRDEQRLQRAAEALREPIATESYDRRLQLMLNDSSEAVREVAGYHLAELGLHPSRAPAASSERPPLHERAGELFDRLRAGGGRPEPAS